MLSIISYCAVPWGSLAEPGVLDGISSMVSDCLGLGGILAETGVVFVIAGISSIVSYCLDLGGRLAETGVVSVVDGISSMVSYCVGLGGTLVETCEVIVDISNGTR